MTNKKDFLSQEEIDALLNQTTGLSDSSEIQAGDYLTTMEQDALGEIGNISFGSAATALSTLLGRKVDITTPQVSAISKERLKEEFPKPHVAVSVNYVEGFNGVNLLVIKTRDAQIIANIMMGGDGQVEDDELTDFHISAVQEAMNQMMGSSATSMSTIFNRFVNISPPGIDIMDLSNQDGDDSVPDEEVFIKVSFRLKIEDLIDSTLMQLLPVSFAKELVRTLIGDSMQETEAPQAQQAASNTVTETERASMANSNASSVASHLPNELMEPTSAMEETAASAQAQTREVVQNHGTEHFAEPEATSNRYGTAPVRNVNVQPVQFSNFEASAEAHADDTNLDLLLDIPLKVTVELGRTRKAIKDILDLSQGSIIELDKLAGEPVDILVNNKLIAKGEVVVIDENFGVRVTDIVNQWNRIPKI